MSPRLKLTSITLAELLGLSRKTVHEQRLMRCLHNGASWDAILVLANESRRVAKRQLDGVYEPVNRRRSAVGCVGRKGVERAHTAPPEPEQMRRAI